MRFLDEDGDEDAVGQSWIGETWAMAHLPDAYDKGDAIVGLYARLPDGTAVRQDEFGVRQLVDLAGVVTNAAEEMLRRSLQR